MADFIGDVKAENTADQGAVVAATIVPDSPAFVTAGYEACVL